MEPLTKKLRTNPPLPPLPTLRDALATDPDISHINAYFRARQIMDDTNECGGVVEGDYLTHQKFPFYKSMKVCPSVPTSYETEPSPYEDDQDENLQEEHVQGAGDDADVFKVSGVVHSPSKKYKIKNVDKMTSSKAAENITFWGADWHQNINGPEIKNKSFLEIVITMIKDYHILGNMFGNNGYDEQKRRFLYKYFHWSMGWNMYKIPGVHALFKSQTHFTALKKSFFLYKKKILFTHIFKDPKVAKIFTQDINRNKELFTSHYVANVIVKKFITLIQLLQTGDIINFHEFGLPPNTSNNQNWCPTDNQLMWRKFPYLNTDPAPVKQDSTSFPWQEALGRLFEYKRRKVQGDALRGGGFRKTKRRKRNLKKTRQKRKRTKKYRKNKTNNKNKKKSVKR